MRRAIQKIHLLQRESTLRPIRIRDTEFAFGLADAGKQPVHRAWAGPVQKTEQALVVVSFCREQQLPFLNLIVEERRKRDGEPVRSEERRVGKECRSRWSP